MLDRKTLRESARRVYGEVVRGRTRVKVVPEMSGPAGTPPRFLLSTYRSGTTLFRYCMDSHPDVAAPPESDYLAPLMSLLDDKASMTGLSDLGYDQGLVEQRLSGFARQFLDTYAQGNGGSLGWVDKSPRYAEQPDNLRRLFPDGRYVIMHRHPLDQVNSFTKGGRFVHSALGTEEQGLPLVLAAAQYWVNVTRRLTDFSNGRQDSLSITYEELCGEPSRTLGRVLDHYQLSWNESVLRHHEQEHDLGREAGRVSGTVGFSRSSGAWRSWPREWQDEVWRVVAPTAGSLGYGMEPGEASGPVD